MRIGKITENALKRSVLKLLRTEYKDVKSAAVGSDCAFSSNKEAFSAVSTVTADISDPVFYAVMKAQTALFSQGITPDHVTVSIMLPADAEEKMVKDIVKGAISAAKMCDVPYVGGHTEVSDAVNKMIVVSTAFGLVRKGGCVPLGKAMPGDSLIMTKTAGIEGSFIAANEHRDKLAGKVSDACIEEALSYKKLISVVKEGAACGSLIARSVKYREDGFALSAVDLMHDVTEGGVFGAAFEMADFSKTGVVIDKRKVPFTIATSDICAALGLDPFRLISSGSLMIATPEPDRVIETLDKQGVSATVIGRFTDRSEGVFYIENDGAYVKLSPPGADEIYSI